MANEADTPVADGLTTATAVNSDLSEPDDGPRAANDNASQQPNDCVDDPNTAPLW